VALDAYTDELHSRYGGPVGSGMDDQTWAACTPEEVTKYRLLEKLVDAEHAQLKEVHRGGRAA
jgi:hypothetical protein